MTHLVASIVFEPGRNDGPATCACGWEGRASEFAAHRTAAGEPPSYNIRRESVGRRLRTRRATTR